MRLKDSRQVAKICNSAFLKNPRHVKRHLNCHLVDHLDRDLVMVNRGWRLREVDAVDEAQLEDGQEEQDAPPPDHGDDRLGMTGTERSYEVSANEEPAGDWAVLLFWKANWFGKVNNRPDWIMEALFLWLQTGFACHRCRIEIDCGWNNVNIFRNGFNNLPLKLLKNLLAIKFSKKFTFQVKSSQVW